MSDLTKNKNLPRYFVLCALLASFSSVCLAQYAAAQGNSGKGGDKGSVSAILDKPGKGKKALPPGQIKRYTRGAKLPGDLQWQSIGDLSKWKLPSPGKGNKYIKVDNEILKVTEDIGTVLEAMGIVADLLR